MRVTSALARGFLPFALALSLAACDESPAEPAPQGPQSTFLSITSTVGDYIAQGQSARYGVTSGQWSTQVSADRREVTVNYNDARDAWNLILAAPRGEALRKGTYSAATQYPFQAATSPGLIFFGNARTCSTVKGSFVIHDIDISSTGEVDRLHATFRQHCGGGASYLDGEVAILDNPLR
jgi:hypothetical protein